MSAAPAVPALQWGIASLDGAGAADPAQWNGLARRGFHLHQWFRAAEDRGWRPRHVAAREGAELRLVIPAYLTDSGTPQDLHDRWLGPLRGLARIGLELRPVLSVQSPFSLTSDTLGDANALPRTVLARAFDLLEETAAHERAKAVVWPFVDSSQEAVIALARERGYAVIEAGVTACLRLWWDTFDEYVASRSKSVRRTIRSDLAALAAAGLESVAAPDFRVRAAEMDALYRLAYLRRNGRDARIAAGYFERLAARPTPGISVQLTSLDGRLVGTSVNLAAGSLVDGTFAAFAAAEHGGPAYLNDLVYQPIRLACGLGIPALDLGMSALYPKVLRGARLRRRVALVRGTGPAIHQALIALGTVVGHRQRAKERRMLGPLWRPGCYEDGGDTG